MFRIGVNGYDNRILFCVNIFMFLIEKLGLILFETLIECLARYSQAEGGDGLVAV